MDRRAPKTAAALVLAAGAAYAAYRFAAPPPPQPPAPPPAPAGARHLGVREVVAFGGAGRIVGIAADREGNLLVAGALSGTLDLGGGPLVSAGEEDVFVAKLDARGKHVWSKRFGGPGYQVPHGIAVDAKGDVVVVGTLDQVADFGGGPLASAGMIDVFVIALGPRGEHLWSKRFGDAAEQEASSVVIDRDGSVILAGSYEGTLDFGGGPLPSAGADDIYLAKLDPSGKHLWSKRFGDGRHQKGRALALDGDTGVALVGTLEGTVDFGGGPLVAADAQEMVLARFDGAGEHVASKRFPGGAGGRADPRGFAASPGGWILAGGVRGTLDVGVPLAPVGEEDAFVLAISPDARPLFARRFGGTGAIEPKAAARLDGGGAVVVGRFEGDADLGVGARKSGGRGAAFVIALDAGGVPVDALAFSGEARSEATSVAVGRDGDVWVGVNARGPVDFGKGPVAGPGVYLVKLAR